MFWNKDKKLPDLPPMPSYPLREIYANEPPVENNSLPSFPDSPSHNSFSQAMIKDAVRGEEKISLTDADSTKTVEMEEWEPNRRIPELPELPEMHEPSQLEIKSREERPKSVIKNKERDIFVKIEKFHGAKKSLKDIQQKLEEVEDLIKKIREVKLREEQELSSWEREMTDLKDQLKNISDSIFDKAD